MKKLSVAAILFSLFSVQFASAHGPVPIPIRGKVECFAKNRRGQVFSARGFSTGLAQRQALAKCKARSRHCVPAGCKRVHGF